MLCQIEQLFHLNSIYVRSFESLLQLVLVHLRLKNVSYSILACKFGRGKKKWIMKIRIFSCRSLGFGVKLLWKRVHDYIKYTAIFKSILKFMVTWWSCFFLKEKNYYTFEKLLQCLLISHSLCFRFGVTNSNRNRSRYNTNSIKYSLESKWRNPSKFVS